MSVGEPVGLVDGAGNRADATITSIRDRSAFEAVVGTITSEPHPEPRLVVVQALPKGERGELAVELLTEVGVDEIVPWSATNCVSQWKGDRAERAHRRWADAAQAAGKQARRSRFPIVSELAATSEVVRRVSTAALALVLHESSSVSLAGVILPEAGDIIVVVGPEGGLVPAELDAFAEAGAVSVRLGPSVLRTSSAGMAAASVILSSTPRWSVEG
jgi:16S rRNA (uracil1498-N3)-methyltransferase